jgi:hypothetical protein
MSASSVVRIGDENERTPWWILPKRRLEIC